MPIERIVLIPPSEEQASAAFHVVESLLQDFLEHLADNSIDVLHSPGPLGPIGPKKEPMFEIEIDEDVPLPELEVVFAEFLDDQGLK